MKKFGLVGLAAVMGVMIGAGAFVFAQDEPADGPKGEKGILVGTVISVADFAMYGRIGEEHAASGQLQIEHGMPVAIIEDETEEVWFACFRDPAPASHLESATEVLSEYMGKMVTVQGLKYRAKGVNFIRISVAHEY